MDQENGWKDLVQRLHNLFGKADSSPATEEIRKILTNKTAANIGLAIEELQPEQAKLVFGCLDDTLAADVLAKLDPETTTLIVDSLLYQGSVDVPAGQKSGRRDGHRCRNHCWHCG